MIMKNSVIASVKVTIILSVVFFIASIFDELFLPLGFYVWNLLPVLLFLDCICWCIDELFERFNNRQFDFKSYAKHSNPPKCPTKK